MEIFEPGESPYWGSKKHEDLVAYVASHLAVEYQHLTGHPIVEILLEKNQLSAEEVTNILGMEPAATIEQPSPPPSVAPQPVEDALPL